MLQGTYLPASVADDLLAMQEHQELVAAMAQLQQLFEAAGGFRQELAGRASISSMPRRGSWLWVKQLAAPLEGLAGRAVAAYHGSARLAELVLAALCRAAL